MFISCYCAIINETVCSLVLVMTMNDIDSTVPGTDEWL